MKASRIKTWIIRILFIFIALVAAGMVLLSLLAGTSDSHRRGLEQAFSDFLQADVRIGQLDRFNIMPQLIFKTSNVRGTINDAKNEFMLEHLEIAFGFLDIAMGRRRIENFQLNNLRFSSESEMDLRIDYAGLEDGAKSIFVMRGQFEQQNFDISFPVEKIKSARTSYAFLTTHPIDGKFGDLDINGEVSSVDDIKMQQFKNIKLSVNGVTVVNGESTAGKIILNCLPAVAQHASVHDEIRALRHLSFFEIAETCPK